MSLPSDERVKMGLEGREWVISHYSLDAIVAQWEEIYVSLMARKRA